MAYDRKSNAASVTCSAGRGSVVVMDLVLLVGSAGLNGVVDDLDALEGIRVEGGRGLRVVHPALKVEGLGGVLQVLELDEVHLLEALSEPAVPVVQ